MNPGDGGIEALELEPGPAQGDLISFAWWLRKQGRSERTIDVYCRMLSYLSRNGASLEDSESVKEVLARLGKSARWKTLAIAAYTSFLKMRGRHWDPPKTSVSRRLPFIPLESEIDALIAGCGPLTSTLLQVLKETGMRVGEALRLTWSDIDLERRVIILNEPEKNSMSRVLKISQGLAGMLSMLPKKSSRVFPTKYENVRRTFYGSRERLARQLNNPRLSMITFHTLRHWRATMEYHKTKDILHVKELLGHRDIENTMLYIQVEKALFNSQDDEFTVRVAKDPQEIKGLLEAGFEYVCEKDDLMFFRRRK